MVTESQTKPKPVIMLINRSISLHGFLIVYQIFGSIIKPFLSLLLYFLEHRITLWKLEVQLVRQMHKSRHVIEGNATDEVNHYEIEERDDPHHTQYITWPGQDADDNQRLILQLVSGNGGRKLERKAEMRHDAKERLTNLTALKLFARQEAEKSQLKEWKADLLHNLISKIAQIYKAHNNVLEAQRKEMERQQEQFQFKMEVIEERKTGKGKRRVDPRADAKRRQI